MKSQTQCPHNLLKRNILDFRYELNLPWDLILSSQDGQSQEKQWQNADKVVQRREFSFTVAGLAWTTLET